MAIPPSKENNSDSRVYPIPTKQGCGLSVQKRFRLDRVETLRDYISEDLSNLGPPRNRPVRLKTKLSGPKVFQLETRPPSLSNRCFPTAVVKRAAICIPTILPNREGDSKGNTGSSRVDSHCPTLDSTDLVSLTTRKSGRKPNKNSNQAKVVIKSQRGNPSTIGKQNPQVSGMENLRKNLQDKGISERAAKLITTARSIGTRENYNTAWRKFHSWCSGRKIDPFRCDVSGILEFLSELFELGYQYRTINNYRSAISAFHEKADGIPVGKNNLVCSLMLGISNERPPQPRYTNVWDVQLVLNYLLSLPYNDRLTLKQLTLKTVGLLALSQINRGSELKYLDLKFMRETDNTYIFSFNRHTKTSRKGNKRTPDLEFSAFEEEITLEPNERKLCPYTSLKFYLKTTQNLRGDDNIKTQVFIGQIKPHKEVVKSTIAGWLKLLLKKSGINTEIFKAHSFRCASSSKAHLAGVSIQDILKTGNWTNTSTWQKFYHKPINTAAKNFQKGILKRQ